MIEEEIYSIHDALPEIRELADHEDWKKREGANICRVASEGKRGKKNLSL